MITKFAVYTNSLIVIAISALSIHSNSYYLDILFNTSMPYAILRSVLVCGLLAYILNPKLRTVVSRKVLGITGVALFIGSIITFATPSVLGYSSVFYPIGDSYVFSQIGLWASIVAVEMPATKTRFVAMPKLRLRVPSNTSAALGSR